MPARLGGVSRDGGLVMWETRIWRGLRSCILAVEEAMQRKCRRSRVAAGVGRLVGVRFSRDYPRDTSWMVMLGT